GLVVKSLWRKAKDRKWTDILKSVKGIVFIATPHTGSMLGNYLQILFLKLAYRPTVTVEELRHSSSQLRDLNDWYRNHAAQHNVVYFETQPICGTTLVVDEASANPGLPGVYPIPILANHISICKPPSR